MLTNCDESNVLIPVRCVVSGHEWFTNQFNLTFCHRCGQDKYDEIPAPKMWWNT